MASSEYQQSDTHGDIPDAKEENASGGRSALGGKVLKDMGYGKVYNVGAFKDWAESGGAIEKPIDTGM